MLEKEERSGDSGRSVKRGVLPEACCSQTIKRGKAVLEPSSNPERVTLVKHNEYCAHDHLTQAGSTSTLATVMVPSTESSTAAIPQTAVTITRTRKPPAPPPVTEFLGTGQHPRTADREEPKFQVIPTLTRTLLTTTIIISSLCLLDARHQVSSILDLTRWLTSTKFA